MDYVKIFATVVFILLILEALYKGLTGNKIDALVSLAFANLIAQGIYYK